MLFFFLIDNFCYRINESLVDQSFCQLTVAIETKFFAKTFGGVKSCCLCVINFKLIIDLKIELISGRKRNLTTQHLVLLIGIHNLLTRDGASINRGYYRAISGLCHSG